MEIRGSDSNGVYIVRTKKIALGSIGLFKKVNEGLRDLINAKIAVRDRIFIYNKLNLD